MFEKINFGPGKVFNNDLKGISVNTSNKEWLKKVCDTQDLFMVDYPEGYVIHVGWFYKSKPENGRFTVSFFKSRNLIKENYNNNLMIKKKCCSTLKSLDKTVRKFNEIIKKRLSKDQELYNKEKPTTFKEFLKSMDMTPAMGSPLLKHLPNKKFLPLIEKEMKKDIQPHILTNPAMKR
ncbi:MAG: hypothetical protein NTW67_02470 [Candidatus Woesearchaeota archaeon]|nr:hypothetical protein [Candidatus Woesearchaeota archaeon]